MAAGRCSRTVYWDGGVPSLERHAAHHAPQRGSRRVGERHTDYAVVASDLFEALGYTLVGVSALIALDVHQPHAVPEEV